MGMEDAFTEVCAGSSSKLHCSDFFRLHLNLKLITDSWGSLGKILEV